MKNTFWISLFAAGLAACGAQPEAADAAGETETATLAEDPGTAPQPAYGEGDALVEGTDYNATTLLKCGFEGAPPEQTCEAGIKRNWGNEGEHLIEVSKPDGRKRAIFLRGTEPYGADSAQADGSAGWDFEITRDEDQVTVSFGPETYVLVDAMVTGG